MGVGDFGEDGDFCGDEAIVETRIEPGAVGATNRPQLTVFGTWKQNLVAVAVAMGGGGGKSPSTP